MFAAGVGLAIIGGCDRGGSAVPVPPEVGWPDAGPVSPAPIGPVRPAPTGPVSPAPTGAAGSPPGVDEPSVADPG